MKRRILRDWCFLSTIRLVFVAVLLIMNASCSAWMEQTRYATGYSDEAFDAVTEGMSPDQVRSILGEPLRISTQDWRHVWSYFPQGQEPSARRGRDGNLVFNMFGNFAHLSFGTNAQVVAVTGDFLPQDLVGRKAEDVRALYGNPFSVQRSSGEVVYHYSLPGKTETYKIRDVYFDSGGETVVQKKSYLYHD